MKKRHVVLSILVACVLVQGCTRKFAVTSQMSDLDFTVSEPVASINYTPIVDSRPEIEKKGRVENGCSGGKSGVTHLGDKNYKNDLLPEFNDHLLIALQNSHLFTNINVVEETSTPADADYSFMASLESFHVMLDEAQAQNTQACIGGIIGAMIASKVDVTANIDVKLTGILKSDNVEVWRYTVIKHSSEIADYGKTKTNAELLMGNAIGDVSRDIISEMAKFLSTVE
ncbi:MAG: hypothetical protein KOO63_12660 [Bacteroidales bacterium]|nr:hypothetical protein [Candidatus Latescibacterota bacterium]